MPSLISFLHNNAARFGRLDGETVTDLTASFDGRFASLSDAANAGALAELYAADGASVALADVTLKAPLPFPGKIICVGVNFPDRNAEYKDGQSAPTNPSLFIRFPGSFVGHGDVLRRPPESEQLDYEGEIAIVIGAGGRRIEAANAWDHIAAVTLCNEGTIRDWVRHAKFNLTLGMNFE